MKNLFDFLVDFLDLHFEGEEIQMEATRYPDLKKHKAFYDRLRIRVHTLVEDFHKDPEGAEAKVVALVQDWLDQPIGGKDKKKAKHFLECVSQAFTPRF
ncbi:MAG TPA: hypothetical protein VJ486_03000 [Geothrix sp.]|nr:hypothetical protein [Geothrix sp.]